MSPKVSVVIGFRNWGRDRLRLSIRSIINSFDDVEHEVILSDYGSKDHVQNKNLAQELGVRYIFTDTENAWSRSRALNAGFSIAQGDILISTDADMLFSPGTLKHIAGLFQFEEKAIYLLQCRDLPLGMNDTYIIRNSPGWKTLEFESRVRPRWGMGGMMAITRKAFTALRGYDERLHTYGGEDIDITKRARRFGLKLIWVDTPSVRMYHMWHPPTRATLEQSETGRAVIRANRQIAHGDKTFIRNVPHWVYASNSTSPTVSVAICTRNRAEFLKQAIQSILNQTFQDFEVVVIDDGGQDNAEEIANSFDDSRIRYYRTEHRGISAARNMAADLSKGIYTAVLDDDDLMHPRRLEWQVSSLEEGTVGNAGAFANFDEKTGSMHFVSCAEPSIELALGNGGAPGHSTWLVRTDVLKRVRYDEGIKAAVDNNIFLRMLISGYNFTQVPKLLTLRRVHKQQITYLESGLQEASARDNFNFLKWIACGAECNAPLKPESASRHSTSPKERKEMLDEARPFLPDHLGKRYLVFNSRLVQDGEFDGKLSRHTIYDLENEELDEKESVMLLNIIDNASYKDMLMLRRRGIDFCAHSKTAPEKYQSVEIVANQALKMAQPQATLPLFVAFTPTQSNAFDVHVGNKLQITSRLNSLPSKEGSFVIGDTSLEEINEN